MTAVEKIILEIDNELQTLESCHGKEIFGRKVGLAFAKRVAIEAKKMEKQEKIEFADKYGTYLLQGGIMSAVSYNETFKSE